MKNILILSCILLVSISSCHKRNCDSDPAIIPQCIEEKLVIFQQEEMQPGVKLDVYTFQNATVYAFDYGSIADASIEIYSANCNHLGTLNGFAGLREINGEDFFANAVFVQTIWSK